VSDEVLEKDVLTGVSQGTLNKLKKAGITTVKQLAATPIPQIVTRAEVGEKTAAKAVLLAQKKTRFYKTALELLEEREETVDRLTTGIPELDGNMKGGFESGCITELIGAFGSGKTQMCYTAAVLAQLPEREGGLDGKVIVIDTENTFKPDRVYEIAESRELDPVKTLTNIHVKAAYSSQSLEETVGTLSAKLQEGGFKVVIVDSMASHFRGEYMGRQNLPTRQGKLGGILSNLLRFARVFNLVVLVTNQVTANPSGWGNPEKPALGNIMAHAGTHRIWLRKGRGLMRIAKMLDSPNLPETESRFFLTEKGVEGIEEESASED